MPAFAAWVVTSLLALNAAPECSPPAAAADDNIASAAKAVLAAGAGEKQTVAVQPWDQKTRPLYFDRVDARFHLTTPERATLDREGFVVPERLDFGTYGTAFHEVFRSQLPVYVGSTRSSMRSTRRTIT